MLYTILCSIFYVLYHLSICHLSVYVLFLQFTFLWLCILFILSAIFLCFFLIYLLWLCYSAQLLLMNLINLLLARSFFPICSLSPFFFIFIVSFHFILNYSFITIYCASSYYLCCGCGSSCDLLRLFVLLVLRLRLRFIM